MWNNILSFFRRIFGIQTTESDTESPVSPPETPGMPDPKDFPEDGVDVFDDSIGERIESATTSRSLGPVDRSMSLKPKMEVEDLGPITSSSESGDSEETVTITQPRYLWCLDNGHGELQEGKRSPRLPDGRQLEEWEFNRDIVRRIILQLEDAGVQYYNVVPETQVGSFLKERVTRANSKESDLGLPKIYVSVHSNAAPLPAPNTFRNGIDGIETFCHPGSNTGRKLARVFQTFLVSNTGWRDRGVKEKAFYVLATTKMPAILTENGFYTDEAQTLELLSEEGRQKIADAHVQAIIKIEQEGIDGLSV